MNVGKILSYNFKLHSEVDQLPFLTRYSNDKNELTLLDHLLHLRQLYVIYHALETRIAATDDSKIQQFCQGEIIARAEKIQTDIKIIESKLSANALEFSKFIAPSTNLLQNTILSALPLKLLGHFCTRILGDVHGGQALSNYVGKVLNEQAGISLGHGLAFYSFKTADKKTLNKELTKLKFTENEAKTFLAATKESFQLHHSIFQELEQKRNEAPELFQQYHPMTYVKSSATSYCSFFKVAVTAGLVVATLTTTTVAYRMMANGE